MARPIKPTGNSGSLAIDRLSANFQQLVWPKSKVEIEDFVLRLALLSSEGLLRRTYDLRGDPIRNAEADFDFTIRTSTGEEQYVDLTEFVPLVRKGSPYANSKGWYLVGDMAEAVWTAIDAKDSKYGRNRRAAVHLLVYITHCGFSLGREVRNLLSLWCRTRGTSFRSIAFFQADTEDSGEAFEIYPRVEQDLSKFAEEPTKQTCVLLGDLAQFRRENDGAVSVPISGPQGRPTGPVVIQVGGTIHVGNGADDAESQATPDAQKPR